MIKYKEDGIVDKIIDREYELDSESARYFMVYKRSNNYFLIKQETYELVKIYLDGPLSKVGNCYIITLGAIKKIERESSKPKLIAKYSYIFDKNIKDNDNMNKDDKNIKDNDSMNDDMKILSNFNFKKNI